jgi:Uma2 family endonuclease
MTRRAAALLTSDQRPRYLEPLAPIVFPEEAELPESQHHLELRTLLYHLLSDHLGLDTTVGSDQFVYYDAADPKKSVAPDVYVRLEPRAEPIRSWKTWERGAPDVAVEIISDSDANGLVWSQKLTAYGSLGVRELVRFESDAPACARLRIWDRVDDALIERELTTLTAPSSVLALYWVVAPAENHEVSLRIADEQRAIVLTRSEARKAAEARVLELEEELRLLRKRD